MLSAYPFFGMLTDGNAVQMMAELRQQDKTLWQKIRDWFKDLAGKLKAAVDAYKGVKPDSTEGKMVADMQDVITIMESLYTDALVDASENYAAGAQKSTTEGGVNGNQYSIREGMTEQERYKDLKDKEITVISDSKAADYSKDIASLEALKTKAKSKAEKIIKPLAKKLGIINTPLSTTDVETEFLFTASGGLAESMHKQLRYGGSYVDFAKTLINLDHVLETAILIEAHGDKYAQTTRANEHLEAVYVLFGAFRDGNSIIPVQMEIKKSSDVGGRLYLTVAMTKIEADVVGSTPGNIQASSLVPASTYSLAEIFSKINPQDKHFLKYLPDGFLSKEQIRAKAEALEEDASRIMGYKKEASQLINANSLDATAKTEAASASTSSIRNNAGNVNKKFSDRDSDGNQLSVQQQEYFKDSKVRLDEEGEYWYGEGRLAPVYHATDAEFTTFLKKHLGKNTERNVFDNHLLATAYTGFWFNSSASVDTSIMGGRTVKAYLNARRLYDAGTLEGLANEIWDSAEGVTAPKRAAKVFTDGLKSSGYDGIVIRDEEMGGVSFIGFG